MSECEFVILGAGAIGSIVGGHLTRAGHQVVMLARGQRASQLQQHGISIRGLSQFTTPVRALSDVQQLRRAETLIVAIKTPGTDAALAALRHVRFDAVLSLQNGLVKDEILGGIFGSEHVLGALADTSGELQNDGAVLFTRNVGIYLGELDGRDSARVGRLAQALQESGVKAAASREIVTLEWSKFCAWVGLMALSVTTRALTWRFLSDPDSALLLVRLMRETGALAARRGITLSDQAVLPSATLCRIDEPAALALIMRTGADYQRTAPQHRMSSLQDVEAGRALEVHETLGWACEQARGLGLGLPLMQAFYGLIAAIDRMRPQAGASP